jgi:hypothetical protein
MAEDYAEIIDNRGSGDIVIVFWFVPQMMGQEYPAARDLLDQYILIGVVHGHGTAGGTVNFDEAATLDVKNANGKSLTLLEGDRVPPAVAGMVTAMSGVMRQSIGAMGQGMHFLVYDNGGTHACQKGQLSVAYQGETYTYNTPIPGCKAD